ncbi:MAG: c-type cytochrome [Campylobacteraceae bacterium]|jgi:cytochrome c553|nr:c-type cytochrome [Campylobacteraceae bacterium]
MRRAIIGITAAVLVLSGCGSSEKSSSNTLEEINKTHQDIVSSVGEKTSKAIEKAGEISQKVEEVGDDIAQKAAEAKEAAKKALQEAANASKDILQKANETLSDISEKADKIINESASTVEAAKQKADNIAKAVAAPLTNSDKGKKLFMTCIPCHGTKAEKSAVNKSQIINKWSREQILKALKGYKDGTYGGAFKAQMVPTAKRLSDSDMEELAAYIVNLGKQ